jgi:hypothetical protein
MKLSSNISNFSWLPCLVSIYWTSAFSIWTLFLDKFTRFCSFQMIQSTKSSLMEIFSWIRLKNSIRSLMKILPICVLNKILIFKIGKKDWSLKMILFLNFRLLAILYYFKKLQNSNCLVCQNIKKMKHKTNFKKFWKRYFLKQTLTKMIIRKMQKV